VTHDHGTPTAPSHPLEAATPTASAGSAPSPLATDRAGRPPALLSRDRGTLAALAALAVLTTTHLAAHLLGADTWAAVTQWALMPLLALALARATRGARRSRVVRLTLLALALSWLGDAAPDLAGESAFLVMVGFFLLAQVAYVVAFWPSRTRSVLTRPARAVPYALALVGLLALCAPGTGALLVPTVVYGTCLTLMAALSTGVHRLAGVGGAVFLVSDSLIALGEFVPGFSLPAEGFWVMATYLAGQCLLTAGVLLRDSTDRAAAARPVGPVGPVGPAPRTGPTERSGVTPA
jgi:uncharacterized membrane protein YhhN